MLPKCNDLYYLVTYSTKLLFQLAQVDLTFPEVSAPVAGNHWLPFRYHPHSTWCNGAAVTKAWRKKRKMKKRRANVNSEPERGGSVTYEEEEQHKRRYAWTQAQNKGFQIDCVLIQDRLFEEHKDSWSRYLLWPQFGLTELTWNSKNVGGRNTRTRKLALEKFKNEEMKYRIQKLLNGKIQRKLLKFGRNRWKY